MDQLLEADTLSSARPRHSQLQPGTPATDPLPEEAGNNEARILSLRAPPTEIGVYRLPVEIWIAVCAALRRIDLIDITTQEKPSEKVYPELLRNTTNKNRPDPIITAVSIAQLSQTCRYLYKVTSPSLLETIRLRSPLHGNGELQYRSVIQKVMSLQSNSNQTLRHVKEFAVAFPSMFNTATADSRSDLRNQLGHLLMRFPNLRHLTVIGMALDAPLMHNIRNLPLEHLWLWDVQPEDPIADDTFIPTTTPKTNLRSLVLYERANLWRGESFIPMNWISQLIGTAMQDLSFDSGALVPPFLPVLPDLEFLEGPDIIGGYRASPSILSGMLSKMPNLKEVALEGTAAYGDPANTIPALAHLECVVYHVSWLGFFIPGRPVTTAKVLCDSQVRMRELLELLGKSSVPLRDLTLIDPITWSPYNRDPFARYLRDLEILRLKTQYNNVGTLTIEEVNDQASEICTQVDLFKEALFHISQLERLRIVSFSNPEQPSRVDSSGLPNDVRQELKLREFLAVTKSPVLERVDFGKEFEWKLEDPGVWILWQGGRM
ncbi:hypothetical protein FRC00_010057, partial [Tulasnella sp. 408]